MKRTFSIGGVHPADNKISRGCAIEVLPTPPTVYISVSQHIGAPAKPIVAVGDKVLTGQPELNLADSFQLISILQYQEQSSP